MPELSDSDPLARFTRSCQIIIGAQAIGVVAFLVIILLFVPRLGNGGAANAGLAANLPIITYASAAVGASVLVLSFVVPRLVVSQSLKQLAKKTALNPDKSDDEDTAALLPIYQSQLMVGAALLEGGAFFAAIAYMLERQPLALVAAGILLGVLVTRAPTRERLRGWVDQQLEQVGEERQAVL
jgi:hypothetical protein